MDKLAKALNKARNERESMIYNAGLPRGARAQATAYHMPVTGTTPAHNVMTIDAAQLEAHRIIAHRTRHKEADIFRILRTRVLHAMAQSGLKTLGITSPNYGDGKTTISLNLAVSIALDLKQTVLLVDLDLRKPNVMEYFGLTAPVGLTDYFTNDIPIANCLIRTSFDRLSLLPAGPVLDNSSEVLGSPKIAALASELKTRYDDRLIIYDMPPILAQDDPLVFLPHMDAVLMVVNEGSSTTDDIKKSMQVLAGAHVIGTVLNNSRGHVQPNALDRVLQFRRK